IASENALWSERTAGAVETRDHDSQRWRFRRRRPIRNIRNDGFWSRSALYRKIFSAGGQSKNSGSRYKSESRLPRKDREARLDGTGDEERSAQEARHLHDQGRLSRSPARLFEARDSQ